MDKTASSEMKFDKILTKPDLMLLRWAAAAAIDGWPRPPDIRREAEDTGKPGVNVSKRFHFTPDKLARVSIISKTFWPSLVNTRLEANVIRLFMAVYLLYFMIS